MNLFSSAWYPFLWCRLHIECRLFTPYRISICMPTWELDFHGDRWVKSPTTNRQWCPRKDAVLCQFQISANAVMGEVCSMSRSTEPLNLIGKCIALRQTIVCAVWYSTVQTELSVSTEAKQCVFPRLSLFSLFHPSGSDMLGASHQKSSLMVTSLDLDNCSAGEGVAKDTLERKTNRMWWEGGEKEWKKKKRKVCLGRLKWIIFCWLAPSLSPESKPPVLTHD